MDARETWHGANSRVLSREEEDLKLWESERVVCDWTTQLRYHDQQEGAESAQCAFKINWLGDWEDWKAARDLWERVRIKSSKDVWNMCLELEGRGMKSLETGKLEAKSAKVSWTGGAHDGDEAGGRVHYLNRGVKTNSRINSSFSLQGLCQEVQLQIWILIL